MPELPEVECWGRRVSQRAVGGKRIVEATATRDAIVFAGTSAAAWSRTLKGATVKSCLRCGKQMWWILEDDAGKEIDACPMLHFGMAGRFHVYDSQKDRPTHVKFEIVAEDGTRLAMTDKRRFGRLRLEVQPRKHRSLAGLGPDALCDLPHEAWWVEQVAKRRVAIKSLLLNQSFIAGVGNWIADEVLYQAKVAPRRQASDLSREEVKLVRDKVGAVIRFAVDCEADYRHFPADWLFVQRWKVRASKSQTVTDVFGRALAFDKVGGRTTAWVPEVQR